MPTKIFLFLISLNGLMLINTNPIHDHLLHCYRGNETLSHYPNTLQIFIELIRKIEDASPMAHDVRTLSAIILHRLRIDGIEKAPGIRETDLITPYRAKGLMSPKFQLLLQMVSNAASNIELDKVLSSAEICQLHRVISLSVEPYERGDESTVCPITMMTESHWEPGLSPRHKNHNHKNVTFTRKHSRCPMEKGAVRTFDYGTFAPGIIIASIAAGLQPQNVQISEYISLQYKRNPWENLETMTKRDTQKELDKLLRSIDTMDNSYSAGLAGDLAEICVYQGPYFSRNTSIGMSGSWNDTYLPRIRYLHQSQHPRHWEMTDSEILAGIDGLFISQQVSSWVHHVRRMRLSQIIDMYYSSRGIPTLAIENTNIMPANHLHAAQPTPEMQHLNHHSENIDSYMGETHSFNTDSNAKLRAIFDDSDIEWKETAATSKMLSRFSISDGITKACNRKEILSVIDRDKLKDETYFLSQVLQFSTSSMGITDEELRANCDATVDRFFNYSIILLDKLPKCSDISENYIKPIVDSILIIDGSRNEFENLQLISFIGETTDISSYGSYLSVVHGSTGSLIVNRTRSITDVFLQLRNFTGHNPIEVSISSALKTAHALLTNQTEHEQYNGHLVGASQVIILVSQGQRPTEADFESAKILVDGSLRRYPDLYYIFLTNDPHSFEDLMRDRNGPNSRWKEKQYHIITTKSINIDVIENRITQILRTIPKRIIAQKEIQYDHDDQSHSLQFKNYFEDYVSPNQELHYRIHPLYFYDRDGVSIEFQGVGYGTFSVCMSRRDTFVPSTCKTVIEFETIYFNITDTCWSSYVNTRPCYAVHFKVQMDSSLVKCAETDCRYPDQVRFVIRHYGLHYSINGGHLERYLSLTTLLFSFVINAFIICNFSV